MRLIRLSFVCVVLASALATMGTMGASAAFAEGLSPWWGVTSGSRPTVLAPGGAGQIIVTAQNRGDASANGQTAPVTITDTLPDGLEAVGIKGVSGQSTGLNNRGPVACVLKTLTCTFSGSLPPYEQIEVVISVVAEGAKTGEQNTVSVSGGGAAGTVSASHAIQVGGASRFGFEDYELLPEQDGGSLDTQAGSHPFQLTTVITLNSQTADSKGAPRTVALPKNIVSELPVGLFGNPTPLKQCSDAQFAASIEGPAGFVNECPAQSAIGVAVVSANEPQSSGYNTFVMPIFNMTPRVGEPARFAFKVGGVYAIYLDTSVRTGGDYGVTVSSHDIPQVAWTLGVKLTFWGVPGDPRHDNQRGWECLDKFGTCTPSTGINPPPFLVLPTSCEAPSVTTLQGDSWGSSEHPVEQASPLTYQSPELIDGCGHLPFSPSISVSPDVPSASTPTGLTVGVHLPQEAALNAEGLAESTLRDTTVTLPEGVTLNPAGADGLEACAETQIGYLPPALGETSEPLSFTAGLPEPFCPDSSKIGTVRIKTPLLPNPLEGAVYLATQEQNPFSSLIAIYLVAQDPVSGTLLKLPGEVKPDLATGRLVSTFKDTPELPFEDLELHFFGGERAPLSTPPLCGSYATTAVFIPWSGNAPVEPSSTFDVSSGPNGSPCANPLPFAPSLTAGSTNIQAGGFSPFTMTMSRDDGSQSLQAIRLRMPPGLSGLLAGVELCGEQQADQGLCGPDSLIGETTVSVGLGGDPFSVKGGKVYITGPYDGAPFGLSIVNPAKAGPFDLEKTQASQPACDCLVVRAKIEVDPVTADLTITSDNTGSYKIPTMLEGIPLQIKHVNVTVNRPGFTFNPTNCNPMAVTGSLDSSEGAVQALSVPFQATNCAVLGFKPGFKVSTAGKTSRAKGASLTVKLTYPKTPFGSQANIKSVKVDLPKQLPSRLTTLQKACTSSQFQANPAGCPPASIVGHATAITPLIPVPLTGPAYFVSYGGAKFPELVIALQGYGVTLDLHGETFISKAGITSSTFHTVPDAPVGSFELVLPQGQYSALAANGNLCASKLAMPTAFTAQNGTIIKQSTPINITGCSKHHKAAKKTRRKRKK